MTEGLVCRDKDEFASIAQAQTVALQEINSALENAINKFTEQAPMLGKNVEKATAVLTKLQKDVDSASDNVAEAAANIINYLEEADNIQSQDLF